MLEHSKAMALNPNIACMLVCEKPLYVRERRQHRTLVRDMLFPSQNARGKPGPGRQSLSGQSCLAALSHWE